MSFWGAFSTSVSGMLSQSHKLNHIGNNVANVNTTAYKPVETNFKTLLSEKKGGTNFMSVTSVDVRRTDRVGTPITTNRGFDLSISGPGYFIANDMPDGSGDQLYTRDGSFIARAQRLSTDTDGDGNLDEAAYLTTSSGAYLMGYEADGLGNFGSTLSPVYVNKDGIMPGQQTTTMGMTATLPSGATGTVKQTMRVYGADGTPKNLTMVFDKVSGSDNQWTLSLAGSDVTAGSVSSSVLNFSGNGVYTGSGLTTADTPAHGDITFNVSWADGTSSSIAFDPSSLQQYASDGISVKSVNQNGYASGTLSSTAFDQSGVLHGFYDNGQSRPLFQLPLARFPADQNLDSLGGNMFRESEDSGSPDIFSMGNDSDITIIAGAVEASTVDLTTEFSDMILTQQAYSSSANVFKTADEMIQTAAGIKR